MAVSTQRPAAGAGPYEQICPDPSAHVHNSKGSHLPEKAAETAMHELDNDRAPEVRGPNYPLDEDGRLSSAGAAASLKYARAHELPSFPSLGIERNKSANSAAYLAHQNQKPFEHWKPNPSANASKAALQAHGYKMAPLWQPEPSAAGAKAASLAHAGPGREWWQPESTKAGNAAAGIAFSNKTLSPKAYGGATENDKMNALLAATASVKGRKRSGSLPAPPNYPDSVNALINSQSAATAADANRLGSRAMEASRVKNLGQNVTPKMFTEKPPIAWDVEDKRHEDALQASAISMAKQMYAVQKVNDDGSITLNHGQAAARTANRQSAASTSSNDLQQQALQYISLQDAAQKLAAERLSKIQNPDETAAFRDYYGYPQDKARTARSRLSVRGLNRRRASSEGGSVYDSSDDERQATRIRRRQNQLTTQLASVDQQKREDDRKKLMAAAERRVHAQMTAMDQKVFDDTGKMSQSMVDEWDARARARAAAASEARMQNHGKVSVGGGKFMDQSAIDAIALARVKPTLDQINDTAEKQRARDEEARLDAELQKRQTREEKMRAADVKAEQKRIKHLERDEHKAQKAEEKRLAREEKDAQKARREEEKRITKKEKRKSREVGHEQPLPETAAINAAVIAERPRTANTVSTVATDGEELEPTVSAASVPITAHRTASKDTPPPVGASVPKKIETADFDEDAGQSTGSPVKRRFKSVLHKLKPKSKSKDTHADEDTHNKLHKKSEVSAAPIVAAAAVPGDTRAVTDAPDVSPPLSDESDDELYAEPSNTEPAASRISRSRSPPSSLASDDFEEARDTLVAPAPIPAYTSRDSQSPNRESRFHEEV